MQIYLAGPLFAHAHRSWHRKAKRRIEAETGHTVIWPGEMFPAGTIESWGDDAPRRVMETCRDAIDKSDLVVALLDGAQVDDGTAWEIGYAHAKGVPVIGIRTDFRQAGDVPGALVNAMIHGSCRVIVKSVDELVGAVKLAGHGS